MKSPELPSIETPPTPEPSPQATGSSRELVYADSFKEMIRNHPGIIRSFNKIMNVVDVEKEKDTLKYGDIFKDGEVQIKVISASGEGTHEGKLVGHVLYFKAQVGDESFFVKATPGLSDGTGLGAEEFRAAEESSKVLEGMDRVKVIDFQLGYQDDDKTYFVSKWKDAVLLGEYLMNLSVKKIRGDISPEEDAKRRELHIRENSIGAVLHENGFEDYHFHNVLYEPSTDMMYVFDVHKKGDETEK